jgi:hypothetical protein
MKKILIGVAILIIAFIGAVYVFSDRTMAPSPSPTPTPASPTKGMLQGGVVLGPICPVERIPPDPNCASKPYVTKINIRSTNSSALSVTVPTNASGTFSTSLDPGMYTLHVMIPNNAVYPRCTDVQVDIAAATITSTTILCDTGIR